MANLLVRNKFFWIALIWTIIIVVLCLEPASDLPNIGIKIKNLDKVVHAIFHFVFTTLWFLFFISKSKIFKQSIVKALIFSIAFGIIIEISQRLLTTSRQSDFIDVLANITGATLAVLLATKIKNSNLLKNILAI